MSKIGVLLLSSVSGENVKVPHPEEFVNVLAGTAGGQNAGTHHSTGNVLPLVARPWGFNHWAPQSVDPKIKTSWWFDANSDTFYGLRCTHQPSPWIGDYAWFLLVLETGYHMNHRMGFTSYYAEGALRPFFLDLKLGPYGHQLQMTPTNHGGLVKVTFPSSGARKLCAQIPSGVPNDKDEKLAKGAQSTSGYCRAGAGGVDLVSRRFADGAPPSGLSFFVRMEAVGGATVEEHLLADCFEQNVGYEPMNMPGQERIALENIDQCQQRCKQTAKCAHFTWWSDGGCHLQDDKAKKKKQGGLQAGPPACQETTMRHCCFVASQQELEIQIGTSFISAAQAKRAMEAEVKGRSFAALVTEGRELWRKELQKVEVLDAGPATATTFRRLEVFYTSLYRALLFPRRLDEDTPTGVQHWSPYSGQIMSGIGVSDNGFWDTFRTVYPLLSIAYPTQLANFIVGWLNAYQAGGWLPKWASPGYRDSMVGTFADVVLADAVIKNISGFDLDLVWQALYKDAYEVYKKDSSRGKKGLEHYKEKGFVPIDVGVSEACSRTLDFAFADAACAAVARRTRRVAEAEELQQRSRKALRELYDAKTGLMGHRKKNQDFVEEAPETWGDCYTEGSAWHHSFPPFDLETLAELHGGREGLVAKLESLFTVPADFKTGSYKGEIHEMREMRMLGMGQYAHNNQPTHHLPYLFSLLGDQNRTARLVRDILSRAYSPEGFAGDEDNGEMGSWYVLSALGLYQPAPGVTENFTLGAVPLFPRARLRALDITVEAPSAAEAAPAVQVVLWRSSPIVGTAIAYSKLRMGGILRFLSPETSGQLGNVVSSFRGALHRAARQVRQSAERSAEQRQTRAANALPAPSASVVVEEVVIEAPEQGATSTWPMSDAGAVGRGGSFGVEGTSWILDIVGLVLVLLALFLACPRSRWRKDTRKE
ncbi:unnamed protein product [Durusdinium trenchii]|uniref:Apple domain-containing protein n=2 Tax=Durusdinium trenchii TaxID=1381693 RepID=A0ABP0S269_9DINO